MASKLAARHYSDDSCGGKRKITDSEANSMGQADQVREMLERVNSFLDQDNYDQAYLEATRTLIKVTDQEDPNYARCIGFVVHYMSLVILYANRYYLSCARGERGEAKKDCAEEWGRWKDLINSGHDWASQAVDLLPGYQQAQGILQDYNSIPEHLRPA